MKQSLLFFIFSILLSGLTTAAQPASEDLSKKLKRGTETAREPETEEKNVSVYPNPASGSLNLSLSGFAGRKTSVSILNVIGTVVFQETLFHVDARYTKTIDVTKLANGLYYIKLQSDDYSEIRKVVLK